MTALSRPRAHALLHFTVLLWGMTAILGKSIAIGALSLVFYRVVLVTALMAVVIFRKRIGFAVTFRRALSLGAAGVLVASHWVLFYGAIKVAGVSVAVLCLSSITFFTALLEPVFFRRAPRARELVFGALVVVGVVLLLRLETNAPALGYGMGIASAFFSAAFGTWNGTLVGGDKSERAERVTFYELASASVACALAFAPLGGFSAPWEVSAVDWGLLVFLAVACTAFPWMWSLRVLKTLSPFTVALSISLEPVYSIVFAYWIWPDEERLTPRFYAGAALLILLVAANGVIARRPSV